MNPVPWMPAGTVYGTLLNFRREHALWAPRMNDAPYKAPPKAPVLYIKTANTFTPAGGDITLPVGAPVQVTPSLGLVMGDAGAYGAVLFNDVSVVHESYYRPPIKAHCVDGFLGVGGECVPLAQLGGAAGLAGLQIELHINGVHRQTTVLSELVRDAATLLFDVGEFMALRPGDVLMLGTDCLADGTRPLVHAGDTVEITAPGFLPVRHNFVKEATA